jgi:hypothetical protein
MRPAFDNADPVAMQGTVTLKQRASSSCPEAGRKTPKAPWRTPTNRASEGLLHGFSGSR